MFQAMVLGSVAQTGRRTVCGMLTGAGLATTWSHDRAHRFFSTARWSIDQIGLTVFDLVLAHLIADGAELYVAVDDTAHRRRGKKVHGVGWIHDGSAPSRNKLAFGHRWVVVGVIVRQLVARGPQQRGQILLALAVPTCRAARSGGPRRRLLLTPLTCVVSCCLRWWDWLSGRLPEVVGIGLDKGVMRLWTTGQRWGWLVIKRARSKE